MTPEPSLFESRNTGPLFGSRKTRPLSESHAAGSNFESHEAGPLTGGLAGPFRLIDLTLPTPEENLACDEAMLALSEERGTSGILRFWEPRTSFVVVGYSGSVAEEAYVDRCKEEGVPILRRFTGGGTVLQGPGCLDYALVLPIAMHSALETITGTNRFVMQRLRGAIASLLPPQAPLGVNGGTDLTFDRWKVAGSGQRRGTSHLLFHGVILLDLDLPQIGRLLPMPARRPEYRKGRPHEEFVRNLGLPAASVKRAIAHAWGAGEETVDIPPARITSLVDSRYALSSWNFRK